MPRILHTADWHLGRKLEGRSRYEEQVAVLNEIIDVAEREDVDAVIVAGDVFDVANPPAEAEALYFETTARLADGGRRAVIVIAGNHDSPDRLVAADPYARALGISVLGYPKDAPERYDGGAKRTACIDAAPSRLTLRLPRAARPLSVLALPYPSEARLREVLTADIDDERQAVTDFNERLREFLQRSCDGLDDGHDLIAASHLYVRDGLECESERQIQVGGAYAVDPEIFPARARYVALGHLHRPQEQRTSHGACVRYAGSILQYSFSEAGQQKSVTIIDLDGDGCTHRDVALTSGRPLAAWTDLSGLDELERRLETADPRGWYAISVWVDEPLGVEYVDAVRARFPGIITITPRYRELENATAESVRFSELPLDEQFRQYVQSRFGQPCDDEVMQLFLDLAGRGGDEK